MKNLTKKIEKMKLKGKKDEDEENSDEETREEIEEVIKPLLKIKKIQKENDKLSIILNIKKICPKNKLNP